MAGGIANAPRAESHDTTGLAAAGSAAAADYGRRRIGRTGDLKHDQALVQTFSEVALVCRHFQHLHPLSCGSRAKTHTANYWSRRIGCLRIPGAVFSCSWLPGSIGHRGCTSTACWASTGSTRTRRRGGRSLSAKWSGADWKSQTRKHWQNLRQASLIISEASGHECLARMEGKWARTTRGKPGTKPRRPKPSESLRRNWRAHLKRTPNDLLTRQNSHPVKLALAARLRQEMTPSVKQIAERLTAVPQNPIQLRSDN